MFDFFDEDFPLTKKQEEEYKKRLAEEAEALEKLAMNVADEAEGTENIAETPEQTAEETDQTETPAESPDELLSESDEDVVIENLPKELFGSCAAYDDKDDDEDDTESAEPQPQAAAAGEVYAQQLAEIMDAEPDAEQSDEIGEETDDGELCEDDSFVDIEPAPEMSPYDEMFDGEADDGELSDEEASEDSSEDGSEELAACESADEEPKNYPEEAESSTEEEAEPTEDEYPTDIEEAVSVMPTPADFDLSEDDFAVSPDTLVLDDSLASIDALEQHLREELKSLGEKLESMERVVDNMEDAEIAEGFDYEYDERYFAVEETPAYQHPEMCKPAADADRYDRYDDYEESVERFEAVSEQFTEIAQKLEMAEKQPLTADDQPVAEPVANVEPIIADITAAEPLTKLGSAADVTPIIERETIAPTAERISPVGIERHVRRSNAQSAAQSAPRRTVGTPPAKASAKTKDTKDININLSSSALVKAGAAVAAAALAYKLMGGKGKK